MSWGLLPKQLVPSSSTRNPSGHTHRKLPSVFSQRPPTQEGGLSKHSSTSDQSTQHGTKSVHNWIINALKTFISIIVTKSIHSYIKIKCLNYTICNTEINLWMGRYFTYPTEEGIIIINELNLQETPYSFWFAECWLRRNVDNVHTNDSLCRK